MTEHSGRLEKGLGLTSVFCIATGAMISSGLFILPGMAHKMAGPGVMWSYLLAGLLAMAGAMSIAELTTAMPKAGGDYFFITRGLGTATGTIAGILSWFSLSLKSAFAIVGMATFASMLVALHGLLAGAILCVAFVALNLLGVKEAARVQIILVVGLIALLLGYMIFGIPKIQVELLTPFAPYGVGKIFATAGFVFVSYAGLLNVASVAEEIRNPGRTIPMGLLLSLIVATAIYTLTVFITTGVLPAETLDDSRIPISHGGQAIAGRVGFVAMSIGAILAFVSTANAGIMSASRYLLALSRDSLLPAPLARVNRRFHTPHLAVVVTGIMIMGSLFLKLDILVEAASTVLILTNALACIAIIVLREGRLQNYRPAFKAPLYPWLQIAGIIGLGFVLVEMGVEAYLISIALILAGFLAFWFYGRKRSRQESALLHLVQRLTARELVNGTLEEELKTIIRDRDEIILDQFDHLIERALVLDLDKKMQRDEFFELLAEQACQSVKLSPEELTKRLRQREQESSTLLSPTLAIPHVIVDGSELFEIVLVRSKHGIEFSPQASNVTAAFVLLGSRDQRNLHLRALAAVAQVVQHEEFEKRWMRAKSKQALRDLVLLTSRRREKA